MPVKVNFSDDTESKLKYFQQALTMNDFKIKVQACDGIVVSSALHIASGWVRDMVRDRGWSLNDGLEPVLFLPGAEKRIVALLDMIITKGSAEITIHERGNIKKISEKLQNAAQDLGLKLFNVDVRPVRKENVEDTNNNKVVDVIQIDDDEDDDGLTSDSGRSIDYDELESEVDMSHENTPARSRSTELVSIKFGQQIKIENENHDDTKIEEFSVPSNFGDITSERVADFEAEPLPDEGSDINDTEPQVPISDIGRTEEVKSGDYECSQCNKKFNREAKLKHHIKDNHGPGDSK